MARATTLQLLLASANAMAAMLKLSRAAPLQHLNVVEQTALSTTPSVDVPGVGPIFGTQEFGINSFSGIPYAEPPIKQLRWMAPKSHAAWTAPLNATAPREICIQGGQPVGTLMGEDCLFLNVATPQDAMIKPIKALPVMVWIHGGGYQTGAGSIYCPACLVGQSKNTIVVVTLNYRLNVFGFMASADLSQRSGKGSGNFGIQDQRLAIQWVKEHISSFGGDGNDITIFGESAGGNSVMNHLAQPDSFPGLYNKAIIESGVYNAGAGTMADAQKAYSASLAIMGCPDIACLVDKDADEVATKLIGKAGEGPVVDGVSLTDTPLGLIGAKKYNNKVPVIVGSNRDESAMFTMLDGLPANLTEAGFDQRNIGGGMKPETLQELKQIYDPERYTYPPVGKRGNFTIWYWMNMRFFTDTVPGLGACGTRYLDKLLLAGGSPAVYSYLFAHPPTQFGGIFAMHASEISFAFGIPFPYLQPTEEALAVKMSAYWYSFGSSKLGNPNPKNGTHVKWPQYSLEGDTVLRIDEESAGGITTQQGLRKQACDWQEKRYHASRSG